MSVESSKAMEMASSRRSKHITTCHLIDDDEPFLTSLRRYFVIQLVCLTIAPALISAPVYLSLGRIVKAYGRPFSLLAPRTYAIIFICSDLISLILQAFGGALAATGKTEHKVDTGVHILVAGLAFQVLSLFVFMALATHLWTRVRKGSYRTNSRFDALREYRGFRFFIYGSFQHPHCSSLSLN
jgi:ABC-type uncharacterized transport system permease subunit